MMGTFSAITGSGRASLTRLKNSMIKTAQRPENQGFVSLDNHGLRVDTANRAARAKNARLVDAVNELLAEGRVVRMYFSPSANRMVFADRQFVSMDDGGWFYDLFKLTA